MKAYEKFLATAIQLRTLPDETINLVNELIKSIVSLHLANDKLQNMSVETLESKSPEPSLDVLLKMIEEAGESGISLDELSDKLRCPKDTIGKMLTVHSQDIEFVGKERIARKKIVQPAVIPPFLRRRSRLTVEKFIEIVKEAPIHIDDLAAKLGVKSSSLRVFLSRHRKELKNIKLEKSRFKFVESSRRGQDNIRTEKVLAILAEAGGRISNKDLACKLGKTTRQISNWWTSLIRRKAKQLEKLDYDPKDHIFLLKAENENFES
ncbi:hypothetical protein A7K93_08335 [Candidatus Methylacidiphilum fumarolicum]|uniref:Uncharacterized protein n=3 Tax=Candidatus Methylacidiphilum fumarolicum TaxID=591154 RepID=I0JYA4_METFB|nr:hypothetical protein [Candidatus Methylacidiphilum fumarolicum]MBW6415211.1 hypothetical protein [Candidatus Methylacidiphilum fumarolicum]TFE69824.1 hypothetical protein A7K73_05480 [Candidatus Methylacidiphilum fumarolicum]TFE71689.1 hypothetical protein A7K72_10365 [Candidatus Methylacidiphilum fumarolicum]TFE72605.1 hypothetical protein A7K93_08335 [Candidatus Methylacidiphilum fumarolicum]TFE76696.1 hypothetical protein A7D33_08655 [Candidatus Methylacidiphilum fumarolicum]